MQIFGNEANRQIHTHLFCRPLRGGLAGGYICADASDPMAIYRRTCR